MSQEILSKLAILSIEKEMLEELKYKNLSGNFASQQSRNQFLNKTFNKYCLINI